MNIWFAARAVGNPYIDLLADGLRGQGAFVRDGMEPQNVLLRESTFEGPPDVLHLHWLSVFYVRDRPAPWAQFEAAGATMTYAGVLSALRAAGTAIVWTAHNLGNHERKQWLADRVCHRLTARTADAVIAHSASAADRLDEVFDVAEERLHVVPHGTYVGHYADEIDRSVARDALGVAEETRMLLFVGQIRPYKSVPRLVRTYRRVAAGEDAVLVVAGNPADDPVARSVRRSADGADDVRLDLRFLDEDDFQYYLRAADAVVLPYREILTSGTAVLAMSFGVPVVAPRLGTLADVVGDDGGRLYDPAASGGLAAALRWTLESSDGELARIGRRNRRRAERWDWETVAESTLDVYRRARD